MLSFVESQEIAELFDGQAGFANDAAESSLAIGS